MCTSYCLTYLFHYDFTICGKLCFWAYEYPVSLTKHNLIVPKTSVRNMRRPTCDAQCPQKLVSNHTHLGAQ